MTTNQASESKRGRAASSQSTESAVRREKYKSWTKNQSKEIGKRIAYFRDLQNLSNQELLDKLHNAGLEIKLNTLNGIISGKRAIFAYPDLLIFAAALHVSPVHLLFDVRNNTDVEVVPGVWRPAALASLWLIDEHPEEGYLPSEPNKATVEATAQQVFTRRIVKAFFQRLIVILVTSDNLRMNLDDLAPLTAMSEEEKTAAFRMTINFEMQHLVAEIQSAQKQYIEILRHQLTFVNEYIPTGLLPIFRGLTANTSPDNLPQVTVPLEMTPDQSKQDFLRYLHTNDFPFESNG